MALPQFSLSYPVAEFVSTNINQNSGNAELNVKTFINNEPKLPDYSYDQWYSNEYYPGLRGVKDIVSRGVGIALDGSNTDEWLEIIRRVQRHKGA